MTASRFLPILNLVGCVAISGLIFAQWLKERTLDERIGTLQQQLQDARSEAATSDQRAAALDRDVAQLKEAIESATAARQAEEEAARAALTEQSARAEAISTAAVEQVEVWKKAIAERDAKIEELSSNLTATRARLDEAVKKLKAAVEE